MLSEEGEATRVDHELELRPRGVWKAFLPLIELIAKRDLRKAADALQKRVESGRGEGRRVEGGAADK